MENDERIYAEHPFKRGSMKFDDYNYQLYNPYILLEDVAPLAVGSHRKKLQSIDKQSESEVLSVAIMEKKEFRDYD